MVQTVNSSLVYGIVPHTTFEKKQSVAVKQRSSHHLSLFNNFHKVPRSFLEVRFGLDEKVPTQLSDSGFLLLLLLYSHPIILLNGCLFSSSLGLKNLECSVTESMQCVVGQQ